MGSKDSIASALALAQFLKLHGASVDIVSENFSAPKQLSYLANIDSIKPTLPATQQCVITADLSDNGMNKLQYSLEEDILKIYLTPKVGTINPNTIKATTSSYSYDRIWVVDTQDLASLGTVYTKNTQLFHDVPTIVIDHHAGNENFGTINLVNPTAASTATVVFDLCKEIASQEIDSVMATALLTGIIAKTKSFKTSSLHPHALAAASELMNLGAKRDTIVDHLFRQRPLSTLKLWGAALSNLQHDTKHNIVVAPITKQAFITAGAHESELPEVIDELIATSPEAEVVALVYESPTIDDKICGMLFTEKPFDARELTVEHNPSGTRDYVKFCIESDNLVTAQRQLMKMVKERMGK